MSWKLTELIPLFTHIIDKGEDVPLGSIINIVIQTLALIEHPLHPTSTLTPALKELEETVNVLLDQTSDQAASGSISEAEAKEKVRQLYLIQNFIHQPLQEFVNYHVLIPFKKSVFENAKTQLEGLSNEPSKSAAKNIQKNYQRLLKLAQQRISDKEKYEKEEADKAEQLKIALEKAKTLDLKEDPDLGPITRKKIKYLTPEDKRVRIFGWVHRLRKQGQLMFLVVRDGTGFVQVKIEGVLTQNVAALTVTLESSVMIVGSILVESRAPNGFELAADYWELIGAAPNDFESIVRKDSSPDILMNNRHLVLRGENAALTMKFRDFLIRAFRKYFEKNDCIEVTCPCIVQTQCEGGSTLFEFDYYGQPAYLTQSSQLYLETCCSSMGDVYCVQPSFRAEKSKTPRHLTEFTHIEAEYPFITYDELLGRIENMVCDVVDQIIESEFYSKIQEKTPTFKKLKKPFMRLEYTKAIEFCNEKQILKDPANPELKFEYGDDIPELAERTMIDIINEPVFLIKFPAEQKAFYMQKCADDRRLTESVDLLVPGVGEVVGGSMRMDKVDELLQAYKDNNIDPAPYYWYIDQRRYGTFPHGGFGLGTERLVRWILSIPHIRETCLYPRMMNRATP